MDRVQGNHLYFYVFVCASLCGKGLLAPILANVLVHLHSLLWNEGSFDGGGAAAVILPAATGNV